MEDFSCEAGVQVTRNTQTSLSLIASQKTGKERDWWEAHYGKVIKNYAGQCLIPNRARLTADFGYEVRGFGQGSCPCAEGLSCSCGSDSTIPTVGLYFLYDQTIGPRYNSCLGPASMTCTPKGQLLNAGSLQGFMLTHPIPGKTVELWTHFSERVQDQCTGTPGTPCHEDGKTLGQIGRRIGYILQHEEPGTVPLYYAYSGGHQADSCTGLADLQCHNGRRLSSWNNIIGYVLTSSHASASQLGMTAGWTWQAEFDIPADPFAVELWIDNQVQTCTINDQVVSHSWTTNLLLYQNSDGKGRISITDSSSCASLLNNERLIIRAANTVAWNYCQGDGRNVWLFRPTPEKNDHFNLVYTGLNTPFCINAQRGGELTACDLADPEYLAVPINEFQELLQQWVVNEHGNILHSLDKFHENTGGPLTSLTDSGVVGPGNPSVLVSFQLSNKEFNYWYNYRAATVPLGRAGCSSKSTPCTAAVGQGQHLFNLEAHQIDCGYGAVIKSFRLNSCSAGSASGFQYTYTCCSVAPGKCTAIVTPWSVQVKEKLLDALLPHAVSCEGKGALQAFVLEAKDPGDSNSEVRYDYECCTVPSVNPVSIEFGSEPLNDSFSPEDGLYLPASRNEGRVQMEAGLLYQSRQASKSTRLVFHEGNGSWCVEGETHVCRSSLAAHSLKLAGGAGKPFDVTPPKLPGSDDGAPTEEELRDVKNLKFRGPPSFLSGHASVGLRKISWEEYKPTKKLESFELSTVADWMPEAPQYKPYCAFKRPRTWETIQDAADDESNGWGIDKRNQIDMINDENVKGMMEDTEPKWHPCSQYFHNPSGIGNPYHLEPYKNGKRYVPDLAVVESGEPEEEVDNEPEESMEEATEPTNNGLNAQATLECTIRQGHRDDVMARDEWDAFPKQQFFNYMKTWMAMVCAKLPALGSVAAPLGVGIDLSDDFSDHCEKAVNVGVDYKLLDIDKYLDNRGYWKRTSDWNDGCDRIEDGGMYKIFCDLHCIEDAVLKGNSAVLRSMKGLESHIVSTVQDMLNHYTKEEFEKMGEIQEQLNFNGKQTTKILTDYFGQAMDQNTLYRDQIAGDVKSTEEKILSGQEALQKVIEDNGKSLLELDGWLGNGDIYDPPQPQSEWSYQGLLTSNSSLAALHFAAGSAASLVRSVHRREDHRGSPEESPILGIKPRVALSKMANTVRAVKHHAREMKRQLQQGDAKSAHNHIMQASSVMQATRHALAKRRHEAWEKPGAALWRQSVLNLRPDSERLFTEKIRHAQARQRLTSFSAQSLTILKSAKTIEELSDQQESFAAAEMLVKFETETMSLHRTFSEFASHARRSLEARSDALSALGAQLKTISESTTTCASSDELQEVGKKIAMVDRADRIRLMSLRQTLSAMADGMSRMVSLLVDGGLLLHSVRLAGRLLQHDDHLEKPMFLQSLGKQLNRKVEETTGELLGRVHRGFAMSRLLQQLFTDAGSEVPKGEKQILESAYASIEAATREVTESLCSGSNSQIELLLMAVKDTSLSRAFPAPKSCHGSGSLALWQSDGQTAWLLKDDGTFVSCNTSDGVLAEVDHRRAREGLFSHVSLLDVLQGKDSES
eukprot:TRINITY_DN5574_c0_g2_i7.p1 TRINITY_DN5574_c0_g2~~TRINITY_DN5574_c0_g2_i7.p1  ORF type:complete len:1653 (+),score=261.33 TRINITY_DN5574_c0_g2_i7:206-4960(+)